MFISSKTNKYIKEVRELNTKAKARKNSGLFVAEGQRLCAEIPAEDLVRVFVTEDYRGPVPGNADGQQIFTVPKELMAYISDTMTSQGILCVVKQRPRQELTGDLFIILDTLQDPGNMGTILRTAEAAGVNGILMNSGSVDPYAPKVVRSAMGAVFRMPFMITEDLPGEIMRLKNRGVRLYAAHLKGTGAHYEESFLGPSAFMIGNEGNGLSDETAALADSYLRIPMKGCTESLNAAVAASILMYEALRQRETGGEKND